MGPPPSPHDGARKDRDVAVTGLAYGYAAAGRTADARVLLAEILERSETETVSEVLLAYVYTALGMPDQAFTWLEKAVVEKDFLIKFGLQDPALDALRDDPRFDAVLAAANLPT